MLSPTSQTICVKRNRCRRIRSLAFIPISTSSPLLVRILIAETTATTLVNIYHDSHHFWRTLRGWKLFRWSGGGSDTAHHGCRTDVRSRTNSSDALRGASNKADDGALRFVYGGAT